MMDLAAVEWLGVAGFVLSLPLAILRGYEFWENRVHLSVETFETIGRFGDAQQEDSCYEVLVTNDGGKDVTITSLDAYPVRRRFGRVTKLGSPAMFISDELGLSAVSLKVGEHMKFALPFHQLNNGVGDKESTDEVLHIRHTKSKRPVQVLLK